MTLYVLWFIVSLFLLLDFIVIFGELLESGVYYSFTKRTHHKVVVVAVTTILLTFCHKQKCEVGHF